MRGRATAARLTMMRSAAVSAFFLAGAAAQNLQSLSGTVLDPHEAAVPAVHVSLLRSGFQRQTQTSADGSFRFDRVPPGGYELQITLTGFDPVRQRVRVSAGSPLTVVLQLSISQHREELFVRGEAPIVSLDASGNRDAVSVERGLLDNLPVLDQNYLQVLSRFLDPAGGLGGSPTLIVDGAESRNVGVTASAIQEIRINQNPYTAEYPRWSRRRIEIITKTGTDKYHGTLNVLFRNYHLNARDPLAVVRPPEERRILEGSLFGPLVSGKSTSFLLSGTHEAEDLQSVVFAIGPSGPIRENVPTPQRNTQGSLRLSHQFSDRNAAFWQINYQDQFFYNRGAGGTVLPEAATNYRFREDEALFNQRLVITPKLLSQFRILIGRYSAPTTSLRNDPQVVVSDAFTGGGAQANQLRTEGHWTATWMLSQTARRHSLKYGINVPDWSRRGLRDETNQLGTFYFASLADYNANQPFLAVAQRGNPRVVFWEKNIGAFFQDDFQVSPQLQVSVGLRYDWQNYFQDLNNIQPRVALAWAPWKSRKTIVRAGAGTFYDRSGPGPIYDLLRFDGARLRRYVITDPSLITSLTNAGVEALPTSVVRLDPAVQLPYVIQFSAGIERQLAKGTTVAVQYVGVRGIQQFRSRDANAPPSPTLDLRPDPRLSIVRQIESAGRLEQNALEVTFRGNLAPRISGLAQYTFGKTMSDTGGVNWFPASSVAPTGEWSRADTDRRHQFNLLATANLQQWLNFGLSVSMLSGAPFNITTGRDDNRDGIGNDRPQALRRNAGDGPAYLGVDVRWFREFRLRASANDKLPTVTFSLDAFNILNRTNYVTYVGALSSPLFGRAVAAQPPRRLQLGAKFQF
jgi:hypothetical protein